MFPFEFRAKVNHEETRVMGKTSMGATVGNDVENEMVTIIDGIFHFSSQTRNLWGNSLIKSSLAQSREQLSLRYNEHI